MQNANGITRRRFLAAAGAAGAALGFPAILRSRGEAAEPTHIKIASILTATLNAAFLMPKHLKPLGIEAEVVLFPNITQRMQAIVSNDVQVGYGGLNAAIAVASKGFPLTVLANACDGGWMLVGKPEVATLQDLKGKKVASQPGNIAHLSILWKLQSLKLDKDVELLFMNNNDMPIAISRGDVQAFMGFEPYPTMARLNKWAHNVWEPYDTPMGRTNAGLIASMDFIKQHPDLTRKIVEAHVAATKELLANPKIAAETTVKQFNLPEEVARESLKNIFFTVDSGKGFQDGLKAMGQMMLEAKMVDKLPEWNTFINTSFLRA